MLVVWGIIFALLGGAVSLLFPMQYSAVSQVLIISRSMSGVDPYTQSKSAQQVGENLAELIKTTDFYSKVVNSGSTFDRSIWQNLNDRNRRKKWQSDVRPSVVYGTSLLRLQTYSYTLEEAKNFNDAVAATVVSRGTDYVGGDIILKQVDDPLVSRFPTRPNVIINSAAGFLIGALLASLWVMKYRKHTLISR